MCACAWSRAVLKRFLLNTYYHSPSCFYSVLFIAIFNAFKYCAIVCMNAISFVAINQFTVTTYVHILACSLYDFNFIWALFHKLLPKNGNSKSERDGNFFYSNTDWTGIKDDHVVTVFWQHRRVWRSCRSLQRSRRRWCTPHGDSDTWDSIWM